MAKVLVVRGIATNGEGLKEISYSYGEGATPPVGTTGSMVFSNDEELKAFIRQFEESVDEVRALQIQLAITYLASDGSLRNTNQVIGKTLTVDTFGQSPVKVV